MSLLRQSNLFAAEDFRKIYKTFKNVTFTSYDYDSIKQTLIDNIKLQYPEEFNDFISSSEYIAIIDMLAFLGSTLSFRNDLNSRQNILPIAERRDTIIDLVRLISYQPKRNLPASGLFKLRSIRTTENIIDDEGNNITNIPIFWNDVNNDSWYDQFIYAINRALNQSNTFGRPTKSGQVSGVRTDLYTLNNVLGLEVAYNQNILINGETIPVDIVNPDFTDGLNFFERHPDPNSALNIIYRNDSLGFSSTNTGFFLYFKQGTLTRTDTFIENPETNLVIDFDTTNVNNEDVYVQEIDQDGNVLDKWIKVPSVNGNNVIYNSIEFNERKIFEVITRNNDAISLKFSDGTFGEVPSGIIRTWKRVSLNQNLIIRPSDAQGLSLSIPYTGKDGQEYVCTFTFDLAETVANAAIAETNDQIKENAPAAFYSQDRMVNNEDYNVFPLRYSNQITKIKATNRTYSGHSRFIDINDPTGFHKDLIVLGQDGALYKENRNTLQTVVISQDLQGNPEDLVINSFKTKIVDVNYLTNLFYNDYLTQYASIPGNESAFDAPANMFWKTLPDSAKRETGCFVDEFDNAISLNTTSLAFLQESSIITLSNESNNEEFNVGVSSIANGGIPFSSNYFSAGPVKLSQSVTNGATLNRILPSLRTVLTTEEETIFKNRLSVFESFAIGFSIEDNLWYSILNPDTSSVFMYQPGTLSTNSRSWLVYFNYVPNSGNETAKYEIIYRGTSIVFESAKSVNFYWDENERVFDQTTGKALRDSITVLSKVNTDSDNQPLLKDSKWQISGLFIQEDGYIDANKIEVIPYDADEDGVSDLPLSFSGIVNEESDKVIFKRSVNEYGYTTTDVLSNAIFEDLYLYNENTDTYDLSITVDYNEILPGESILLINGISVLDTEIFNHRSQIDSIVSGLETILDAAGANLLSIISNMNVQLSAVSFRNLLEEYNSVTRYEKVSIRAVGLEYFIDVVSDTVYTEKIGKSFSQSNSLDKSYFYFKWQHYSPTTNRIDPSVTNIIDLIVLPTFYMQDIMQWRNSDQQSLMPLPPTSEQLRVIFNDLNESKMISDQLIFTSGKFKILFGRGSENEYKAKFNVVKLPGANLSDNEVKSRVITAIDEFFNINNWQFGETFYFTELAAYVHKELANIISSIVIVPQNQSSSFGNLFEVPARSDELFLSTATVDSVEIVSTYTSSNLRM